MTTFVKLALLIFCFIFQNINAQQQVERKQLYDYYFSLSAGVSSLNGVPSNIHQESHSNYLVGFFLERKINERFALLSGLELERSIYNLDAKFKALRRRMDVSLAPDGLKYTKLYTFNIGIPLQARYYFKPNTENKSNIFIQGGMRFNFAGSTYFEYRENNETFDESLSSFQNDFLLQIEIMVGLKVIFLIKLLF